MGFVDDVRQYGKMAAGHATGAGLGLDSYEQEEVRRKEIIRPPSDDAIWCWKVGAYDLVVAGREPCYVGTEGAAQSL